MAAEGSDGGAVRACATRRRPTPAWTEARGPVLISTFSATRALGHANVRRNSRMSYSTDDLVIFESLFDPAARDGTSYFEFHPKELPEINACWLSGSMFLRDAAFDFFVECFHSANQSFDYFSFVRFGSRDISRLINELTVYLDTLKSAPTREQLFARYASMFSDEIWCEVTTQPLAEAVLGVGNTMRRFVRSQTKESGCLWILGM